MRVLIVDDDLPTVDVIQRSIRWDSLQITHVDTAYDVSSAKTSIQASVPDILLCDIEMPGGTGIDLMQWIREQNLPCRIIFITCHMSFEYASAAITGRAFGYITKPFDRKQTEAVIAKAVNDIIRHDELLTFSDYGKRYLKAKDTLEEQFWRKLAFGELCGEGEDLASLLQAEYPEWAGIRKIRPVLAAVPHSFLASQWNEDIFRIAFRNLVSAIAMESVSAHSTIAYARHTCIYCLFIAPDDTPVSDLLGCCNRIIAACKEKLDCVASCYIGDLSTLEALPQQRRLMQQFDAGNVARKGTSFSRLLSADHKDHSHAPLDTRALRQLLSGGKEQEIISWMGQTLHELFARNLLSFQVLQSIRQDYDQMVYTYLAEHELQAHGLFQDVAIAAQAADQSMIDFMKWVALTASRTVSAVAENRKSSDITQKIKRYLHQHYRENIALEDIARLVYLSPDYASKRFKADTGISIKEYLNQYRIEKAKSLLSQSGASIGKTATMVGFDNLPYFSTLFKQITGCSPSEWKHHDGNAPEKEESE